MLLKRYFLPLGLITATLIALLFPGPGTVVKTWNLVPEAVMLIFFINGFYFLLIVAVFFSFMLLNSSSSFGSLFMKGLSTYSLKEHLFFFKDF